MFPFGIDDDRHQQKNSVALITAISPSTKTAVSLLPIIERPSFWEKITTCCMDLAGKIDCRRQLLDLLSVSIDIIPSRDNQFSGACIGLIDRSEVVTPRL